ncbi:hypothetical protein MNBD_GAMMA17-1009, partial [hydrothermal vent metagenome]
RAGLCTYYTNPGGNSIYDDVKKFMGFK